jgi:hypothetical protein
MLKKLLNLLFGKKELKAAPMPIPVPFIPIHEEIKKTLEEMKEKKEVVTRVEAVKAEKVKAPKAPKTEKVKEPKAPKVAKSSDVKKSSSKKKEEPKMTAKKGPKKSK